MKSLLFFGMIFLAGCVSTEQRKFDCGIGRPSADWVQFYPSQGKTSKYKHAIVAADDTFDRKKIMFWYQNQEGDVFACSLMYPFREHKKYAGGCFTSQYLIKVSPAGEPVATIVGEIVCT